MKVDINLIGRVEKFVFEIKPGERALLLGPNGAGKSRLGAYIESEAARTYIIQQSLTHKARITKRL